VRLPFASVEPALVNDELPGRLTKTPAPATGCPAAVRACTSRSDTAGSVAATGTEAPSAGMVPGMSTARLDVRGCTTRTRKSPIGTLGIVNCPAALVVPATDGVAVGESVERRMRTWALARITPSEAVAETGTVPKPRNVRSWTVVTSCTATTFACVKKLVIGSCARRV
jgi:hypothetical protein